MAATTGIEWADATANFWIGCTKLSAACDHCYAEADWDKRKHRVKWGPHGDRSPVKAGPIVVRKMQREAAAFIAEHGRKPRVFVNSLSDFADNHKSIQPEWRHSVWQLARECPDVIFMILTKRPQNLRRYLPADWGDGYPNVWIGTTVEHEDEERRVDALLVVPAALRFLSCEPLLGPINPSLDGISWVICGGESGAKARPMHPKWARDLRDRCAAANVPFFFKQWGEWAPDKEHPSHWVNVHAILPPRPLGNGVWGTDAGMRRVGKKRAGRLLEGVEHSEVPNGAG